MTAYCGFFGSAPEPLPLGAPEPLPAPLPLLGAGEEGVLEVLGLEPVPVPPAAPELGLSFSK